MVQFSGTGIGQSVAVPKMKRNLLLIFFFILMLVPLAQAQWTQKELMLVTDHTFSDSAFQPRKPEYLFRHSSFLVKYNPVSLLFGGLLYFYQKAISPQISVDCPYEINCSNFGKKSIRRFGLVKGLALTADRLTRCTPYTMIDLRPIQFSRKNKIIDSLSAYQWHRNE